jgi:hypothetical protein
MLPYIRKRSSNAPVPEQEVCCSGGMNREQPVVARRRQMRAEVQRLVSEGFSSGMRQNEFSSGRGFSLSGLAR